ncbi:Fanconi anemia group C protein-like [Acanthaster planci]|uniref:Fanconi anemia group C protein-like n=1 Tax=Acanthaster planci TaxID=133434 RepID=A0A8B7Z9M8_ACAPL|nr:Fanconi anemia group C protein-like [Acanthaster planci]XP_022101666.1 Fanconi anemia group C protein-like [Acanthaster planci]XP_022101667.1 Fanconi anemia group C protein-like [Acanthaster planci]
MHMDQRMVKQWEERVTKWQTSDKGRNRHPNDDDIMQLRVFLRELHRRLVEWGRPSVVLQNLPNVGRLLGRLCSIEVLRMQEADYQLVLQCVLALYVSQPSEQLEEKAIKWAQSQVRHSVSYYKERNPCRGIAESVGCSTSRFNHTASLKLLESIVEDLNKVPTTCWDPYTNCLVPYTQLSGTALTDLSELCLPLVTGSCDVSPLVECLLSCHGNSAREALSPAFLEAVTKSQEHAYACQCSLELSHEGYVSLWTRYLPALESEVLHLIQAVVPLLPSSELRAQILMSSRGLPRACAENPSLLTGAEKLMELLLHHTGGSASVLTTMDLFHRCVKESRGTIPPVLHCRNSWPALDSLRNLLQADPQDLPTRLLVLHIKNLSNCLTRHVVTDPVSRFQAWLLLARSRVWHRAVLKMSLLGPAGGVPACLQVLVWYNSPLVPDRHKEYQDRLGELITSLRGLCYQAVLQPHDLQCAFSAYRGQGNLLCNIVKPLLMFFSVYGNVTRHVLPDIVEKATGENQPSCATKFRFFLDCIEFALVPDGPHALSKRVRGSPSRQGKKSAAPALSLFAEVFEEYRRERLVGALRLPEELHLGLMGRYDRVKQLLL